MSAEDDEDGNCNCKPGAPLWMGTFADLMSLMLCFFILILSFSVVDQKKYFQVVGSFEQAFGLQRLLRYAGVIEIDGSPIMEHQRHVQVIAPPVRRQPTDQMEEPCVEDPVTGECMSREQVEQMRREYAREQIGRRVEEALEAADVPAAAYDVERIGDRLHIRFPDVIAFGAGGIDLDPRFRPILDLVARELLPTSANLIVTGHTDNTPISTPRFRSNWELSTARAVTVSQYLVAESGFDPGRIAAQGLADNEPLVPNTTAINRATNRRVELVVELR